MRYPLLIASCLLVLVGHATPALAIPQGGEFQVNTYTTSHQGLPAVASDSSGNFVVVWTDRYGQDGDGSGVFAQRYDSSGNSLGSEFQATTFAYGGQGGFGAAVASDSSGNFVVVWGGYGLGLYGGGDYRGVFGQRWDSSGNPLGSEFQVNTYTTGYQGEYGPAVASDSSGNFVVVWDSRFGQYGVFGQRYDSGGNPQGAEFQVNTYTTATPYVYGVAMDADGDFVVVWEGGPGGGVAFRRYDSAGNPQGAEVQVSNGERPAVAMDADGDFVVVWESNQVFGQRYDSAGTAVGGNFQVNTYTTSFADYPAVAAEADGDFVIVWTGGGQGDDVGVFGQRYDSAGAAVGGNFQVNTYTTSAQGTNGPAVATDSSGNFVVVWESRYGQDGSSSGVFGQRFDDTVAPPAIPTTSLPGSLMLGVLLGLLMGRAGRRCAFCLTASR
jgi:hypothetical protein